MRYFLTPNCPPVKAILLVESGSRRLLEKAMLSMRRTWGEDVRIDLVTCYPGLPEGIRSESARVYRVSDYRGPDARRGLYRELVQNGYTVTGIICSAEPVMTKWKWALALRVPAKTLVINENADYFWLDRGRLGIIRRFALMRSGLAGAGAVRTLSRALSFPFTLMYLLLYAGAVHARRALRQR